MKLLSILARFGTTTYPQAEEDMARLFHRQMPGVDRSIVVVDNALPRGVAEEGPGRVVLGGDNAHFEFSAFDRALEHVGAGIWSYDLVHFGTSAFNTLYVSYLERFDTKALALVAPRAACLGHIDCYNTPVGLQHFRSQHWVRTGFFMLPPTEVKMLGTFVSISDPARFFSGRPDAPFKPDAPIDETYRRYITEWLTGGDIGQGVEWHSSFALSPDTLPAFERKALCIMNEHLLSIRLRAMGCRLIDVTWLSASLARGGPVVAWNTGWRDQLAGRDRDAIRLSPAARDVANVAGS
jgi:hypothetical protein